MRGALIGELFALDLFKIFCLRFGGQILCNLIWIVPQNILLNYRVNIRVSMRIFIVLSWYVIIYVLVLVDINLLTR